VLFHTLGTRKKENAWNMTDCHAQSGVNRYNVRSWTDSG
jgi:hypothetical protein